MPSKCIAPKHILSPQLYDSHDGVNSNVLILLQGFGDTPQNFLTFAQKMQLPQTALLTIRAQSYIPGCDDLRGWFDKYDETGTELALDSAVVRGSLQKARDQIVDMIRTYILCGDGWPAERVFVFGFAQGGTMAVDVSTHLKLGGVVSISGGLSSQLYTTKQYAELEMKTDVLLTYGDKEPIGDYEFTNKFTQITRVIVKGKGQEMPKSRQEMEAVMTFFASHLWLRNLALERMADVHEVHDINKC
jgi:predicted esterase